MRTCPRTLVAGLVLLAGVVSARGQALDLPLEQMTGEKPAALMSRYWAAQSEQAFQQWRADYEARKTPEQIAAYQKNLEARFIEAIGGLPERTPLNPQVTGTIDRQGYRIEKIIFESQSRFYVTALLFLPAADRFQPPHPGVLVPCGHARPAKGHDEYQAMGALLALNGMAALVYDPIDQGERGQYMGEGGWPKLWGTGGHSMLGLGSTLLGRNTARFEIWDGIRAIDYLASRPEINPQRIGCTGNSGGGTQTSYLMALDGRIGAAAVSCYLCGFPALLGTIGPQDAEQNVFGQLAFGMDHADYATMRAPRPVLICAATKDFFDIGGAWDTFRWSKRLYTRMGVAERVDLLENDAGHNYNATQREGVARWMSRWLLGKDQAIVEPEFKPLTEEEYRCSPSGQVMLLPGARSAYDLNEDYEKQLAPQRATAWKSGDRAERLAQVRALAGIRKLEALPKLEVKRGDDLQQDDRRIERLLLVLEPGLYLPAVRIVPKQRKAGPVALYLHEQGKSVDAAADGPIDRLVREGNEVLAVDLPGIGQTKPASAWRDVMTAYLLGRSYVGLRAECILQAARWAKEQETAGGQTVRLIAVGDAGIPALHAAALEPDLFASVEVRKSLRAWADVVHARLTNAEMADVVHGALRTYDLPNLVAVLGDKVKIEDPTNGKAEPPKQQKPKTEKKP